MTKHDIHRVIGLLNAARVWNDDLANDQQIISPHSGLDRTVQIRDCIEEALTIINDERRGTR